MGRETVNPIIISIVITSINNCIYIKAITRCAKKGLWCQGRYREKSAEEDGLSSKEFFFQMDNTEANVSTKNLRGKETCSAM